MIERYSSKEIQKIWTDKNKFKKFLKVELASSQVFNQIGKISDEDFANIKKNSKFNLKEIYEIEKKTKHDVIAFIKSVSKNLGEEKKWFHYGLTSTDVVDTAQSLLLKDANKIIEKSIKKLLETLKEKSFKYKNTPIIGRTHGVHAEITSFGLKFLLYFDEMKRNLERFKIARKEIEIGKLSGAVGNFSNIEPEIQDKVCKILKINSSNISTQTLQRDRHSNYIFTISLISSTLEKIAIEIRNLQKTEVREVEENFSKGQKGSSAMPHKKNPISSENITGISRVLKSYIIPILDNNALWHERDISHSSVERIILPDATNLINYALKRMNSVLENLYVNEEKMLSNIWITNGLVFSQRVLNSLINKGLSRDESYDIVQELSLHSWKNNTSFKEVLLKEEKILKFLSKEEINDCFTIEYYLKNNDKIFKRVLK